MPTIPGLGEVKGRTLALGGGAAAVVVGVIWWRKRSAAASSAPAASTDATGSDQLDTGGDIVSGLGSGGTSSTSSGTSTSSAPTSNDQWTALVLDRIGTIVPDQNALLGALGLYLRGQAVTKDQESLIDQAIAAAGYPPTHGPNEYPPGIRQQPATGQTPPPTNVAKRNGNLGVNLKSTPFHSWNDLARWAYWWSGHTDTTSSLNGYFGSLLAHANGQSGMSDPSKLKPIHLPDTLV